MADRHHLQSKAVRQPGGFAQYNSIHAEDFVDVRLRGVGVDQAITFVPVSEPSQDEDYWRLTEPVENTEKVQVTNVGLNASADLALILRVNSTQNFSVVPVPDTETFLIKVPDQNLYWTVDYDPIPRVFLAARDDSKPSQTFELINYGSLTEASVAPIKSDSEVKLNARRELLAPTGADQAGTSIA
ncbi:hypothetical protein BKA62DRAFT_704899 [Auriculariales sp. MPI-PUGE-AT-0066]|nr:hypothetical protein BKA62DRAFT_704899 [Auriculariales sp. MPI-PUGE-AT-0066]